MKPDIEDPFGLVGATLEGRYKVEAAVAEGGFSVVYRARREVLSKPVAIKVLKVPPRLSAEARREALEAFLAEARTLARLEHPAVARVIDFGVTTANDVESPWMALDWISGRTLSAWLAERRDDDRLRPDVCLALLRPVLDALARAHTLGIAHRDVKPSNLMLVEEGDADPPMRLLDFGIAKIMEPGSQTPSGGTRTETAAQAFSLSYAAPEQVTGTRTGPWTDVHGLALVLTEMLTGTAPHRGDDPMALYLQVLSTRRPTPARFGVDVGVWEPVLTRALALLPADRYPDAGALLAALEAEVPSEARPVTDVEAPPAALPPPARAPRRWIAGAAVVALGAALTVASFNTSRAPPPARPAMSARPLDASVGGRSTTDLPVSAPTATPVQAPPQVFTTDVPRAAPRAQRRPVMAPARDVPVVDSPPSTPAPAAPARADAEAPLVPEPAPVE